MAETAAPSSQRLPDRPKWVLLFMMIATTVYFMAISMRLVREHGGVLTGATRVAIRDKEACLVYDKAAHTGSTTVSWALEACWSSRLKFEHHFFERDAMGQVRPAERERPLSQMLRYSSRFVANIHRHIAFDDAEIRQLHAHCRTIFFVTNTRALHERILSAVTEIAVARTAALNLTAANFTAAFDEHAPQASASAVVAAGNYSWLLVALHALRGSHARARATLMTKLPFLGARRLHVDYVIRGAFLEEDTLALLHAFGCQQRLDSTAHHSPHGNLAAAIAADRAFFVHTYANGRVANVSARALREEAMLLFRKDPRQALYTRLARKNNRKGLRKATRLAKRRMAAMLVKRLS